MVRFEFTKVLHLFAYSFMTIFYTVCKKLAMDQ